MRQKTLIKIIRLMRKELDKGQTILGISKQLGIGYRPAYNHIIEMEKEQIIQVQKIGHSKQCKLNLAGAKTRHLLESLDIIKKEELYQEHSKLNAIIEGLISKLAEKYFSEIHSVILFGSYAKGTTTKQSDIDLMFIVNNLKNKNLRESIERESASYQYSYNIKISPLITDVEELKKMLRAKELNVGKEAREHGISLYGHEMFWRIIS
ncbi:MAG: nucleotidyltransferase domain-containing protein [Candidatus Woesearchaeota archaeon]|nr:nucleotidyltransferase domain-containing protein [Candidatus Woesearchaeota archaeon]